MHNLFNKDIFVFGFQPAIWGSLEVDGIGWKIFDVVLHEYATAMPYVVKKMEEVGKTVIV